MLDIQRLKELSMAAQAEVFRGEQFGDARVAFLVEFTDDVLHELVHIAFMNQALATPTRKENP